jgi:hypothetical protein
MDDTEDQAEIEIGIETDLVDIDGDGVIDAVSEVVTTVADVDGDGVADVVEQTTTTAYDVDGDGVADVVESTTVTGVDVNRDGTIDEDEIVVEHSLAVRDGFVDDASGPSRPVSNARRPLLVGVIALGVAATAAVWWRRRSSSS